MVTRMHGSVCQAYLGARDISDDVHTITLEPSTDVHESTSFASLGWHQSSPGLGVYMATLDGFYDKTANAYEQQIEAFLGIAGGILSVYDDNADALGDSGTLLSDAMVDKKTTPRNVADLVHMAVTLKPMAGTTTTRPGIVGKLLLPKATYSATATGSALDNLAASGSGGRANLHVLTATGSPNYQVKIQHSVDNAAWVDLVTFTQVTATGCETKEVTSTVNEYLRTVITKTSGTSFQAVCGFARYGVPNTPTIALTGTVTTAVESDIVTGGKTIILTLTDSTFVASGATFNAQRQNIINGLTSAQSETHGWNNDVKAAMVVANVVRTSAQVVTITLPAVGTYVITANETITATVPAAAIQAGVAVVASPTFVVTNQ